MSDINERPIIFPLSNPLSKSECTHESAIINSDGRVLFASGSPFDDVEYKGHVYRAGQGNNMYVFPGLGHGAIVSKASAVTENMVMASSEALSAQLLESERKSGLLFPELERIRELSSFISMRVAKAAIADNVARNHELASLHDDEDAMLAYIKARLYDPFVLTGSGAYKPC